MTLTIINAKGIQILQFNGLQNTDQVFIGEGLPGSAIGWTVQHIEQDHMEIEPYPPAPVHSNQRRKFITIWADRSEESLSS